MYLRYNLITDYNHLVELHANFLMELSGFLINESTSIHLLATKNEERN